MAIVLTVDLSSACSVHNWHSALSFRIKIDLAKQVVSKRVLFPVTLADVLFGKANQKEPVLLQR